MGLRPYRQKRDFERTQEPPGREAIDPSGQLIFVVQKHHARRLHYDFRLEIEGALRSWAVPKGPSLDPDQKRLAVQVEDHPIEYGAFEGVIPEGQYGAGKVIVWDRGAFECVGEEKDPLRSWNQGKLDLRLHGRKLRGLWLLIRLKEKNQWLLFKKLDEYSTAEVDILREAPESILSGRRVEEIEAGAAPVWNSPLQRLLEELQAPRREIARAVRPMLATLVNEVPEGGHWIYELKYDGVRAVAVKEREKVKLYSRNLKSLNHQFPEIVNRLERIPATSFMLDGELVALDEEGRSRFHLVQKRLPKSRQSKVLRLQQEVPVSYLLFDLLECEGYDLRGVSLLERRRVLTGLAPARGAVRCVDTVREKGREFYRLACEKGLEGVLAKDATSSYHSGRSRAWLKIKCQFQQEFVIVGFTQPSGSRPHFGALLLGLYEDQNLVYAGKVGSGLDRKELVQVYGELGRRRRKRSPLAVVPKDVGFESWVKPELVCQVKFKEWTTEGRLRAPVFLGLRTDRNPQECQREVPTPFETRETGLPYDFLTNQDKVLWPDEGYTKEDLIRFYHDISPQLIPHLVGRPMVLERFPDGIGGESFYQKNAPEFLPDWIPTVEVESESARRAIRYVLCNDREVLVYLANLGCIPLHPWSSRVGQLENPDFLIVDLDPSEGVPFAAVSRVALRVRQVLGSVGLRGYPKTSGATGLHIVVPLEACYSYDQVRHFAEIVARLCVHGLEEIATLERSTEKRRSRVYLDYLQNGWGQTIVSPYCLRARPGAPVSTPLEWEEVVASLRPAAFDLRTIFRRLERKGDLFAPVLEDRQSLHQALQRLESLWGEQGPAGGRD